MVSIYLATFISAGHAIGSSPGISLRPNLSEAISIAIHYAALVHVGGAAARTARAVFLM